VGLFVEEFGAGPLDLMVSHTTEWTTKSVPMKRADGEEKYEGYWGKKRIISISGRRHIYLWCGLTDEEREKGHAIIVGRFVWASNSGAVRALVPVFDGETKEYLKTIVPRLQFPALGLGPVPDEQAEPWPAPERPESTGPVNTDPSLPHAQRYRELAEKVEPAALLRAMGIEEEDPTVDSSVPAKLAPCIAPFVAAQASYGGRPFVFVGKTVLSALAVGCVDANLVFLELAVEKFEGFGLPTAVSDERADAIKDLYARRKEWLLERCPSVFDDAIAAVHGDDLCAGARDFYRRAYDLVPLADEGAGLYASNHALALRPLGIYFSLDHDEEKAAAYWGSSALARARAPVTAATSRDALRGHGGDNRIVSGGLDGLVLAQPAPSPAAQAARMELAARDLVVSTRRYVANTPEFDDAVAQVLGFARTV
jgi:hypothetical protein